MAVGDLVLGITGASGAPYAVRLLEVLVRAERIVHPNRDGLPKRRQKCDGNLHQLQLSGWGVCQRDVCQWAVPRMCERTMCRLCQRSVRRWKWSQWKLPEWTVPTESEFESSLQPGWDIRSPGKLDTTYDSIHDARSVPRGNSSELQ